MAEDGVLTAMIFFDMLDSSDIPSIVEPLFMGIDTEVELLPVMNADDLRKGLIRQSTPASRFCAGGSPPGGRHARISWRK